MPPRMSVDAYVIFVGADLFLQANDFGVQPVESVGGRGVCGRCRCIGMFWQRRFRVGLAFFTGGQGRNVFWQHRGWQAVLATVTVARVGQQSIVAAKAGLQREAAFFVGLGFADLPTGGAQCRHDDILGRVPPLK